MITTLNPVIRVQLMRQAYRTTRQFGRGRIFSALCGLQMLFTGRVRRHRIY